MIEIRRKVKVEKGRNRKLNYKIEQQLAFDYFNYNKTPTELSKDYDLTPTAITSILLKWEPVPKIKRIPIFVTEEQLEEMKLLNIKFERLDKDVEIIQYKESSINND